MILWYLHHIVMLLVMMYGWNMWPMWIGMHDNIVTTTWLWWWIKCPLGGLNPLDLLLEDPTKKKDQSTWQEQHWCAIEKWNLPAWMDLHASPASPHSEAELQVLSSPSHHPLVVTSHLVQMSGWLRRESMTFQKKSLSTAKSPPAIVAVFAGSVGFLEAATFKGEFPKTLSVCPP